MQGKCKGKFQRSKAKTNLGKVWVMWCVDLDGEKEREGNVPPVMGSGESAVLSER